MVIFPLNHKNGQRKISSQDSGVEGEDDGHYLLDDSQYVQIGGIDQFISIQGDDRSNPVILFLHGGPANAQSPFLQEFLPWEKYFTVVNWDQRGSGKTYGKNGSATPGMDTPDAALDRLTADAIEVAEYASRRLGKRKVILLGHSWGAVLGLNVVKRRPDLFYAFVATGLPVSWKQSLEDSEAWARREALSAHDEATFKGLDQAASLRFDDMHRLGASAKYRMTETDLDYLKMQGAFVGPSSAPAKGDAADWVAGGAFTVPYAAWRGDLGVLFAVHRLEQPDRRESLQVGVCGTSAPGSFRRTSYRLEGSNKDHKQETRHPVQVHRLTPPLSKRRSIMNR